MVSITSWYTYVVDNRSWNKNVYNIFVSQQISRTKIELFSDERRKAGI